MSVGEDTMILLLICCVFCCGVWWYNSPSLVTVSVDEFSYQWHFVAGKFLSNKKYLYLHHLVCKVWHSYIILSVVYTRVALFMNLSAVSSTNNTWVVVRAAKKLYNNKAVWYSTRWKLVDCFRYQYFLNTVRCHWHPTPAKVRFHWTLQKSTVSKFSQGNPPPMTSWHSSASHAISCWAQAQHSITLHLSVSITVKAH